MTIIYSIIAVVFVICLIITPIVIKFSKKFNLVDIPKDERRVHSKPMPRVGGIAIVISMLLGLGIYYIITRNIPSIALNKKFLGYLLGGIVIFAMWLIDDIVNLKARYKFLFQLAAAFIVYLFGIRISGIKIPFIYTDIINFGWLDLPITLLWIIGITNAINLIDGLDGLAAGISAISATALLIIFITTSASLEAIVITAVLVGATLGFLPYNFNPAKTFMGDVGSNYLGFTLATVSILGLAKGYTILAIIVPIIALGVPIFDTLFAMIRRFLKGQPMLSPDGAHIHHRLIKRGFSQRQAVIFLYTVTSILCILAVTIISADIWKFVILIIAIIIFIVLALINFQKTKYKPEEDNTISDNFVKGKEK
ncbi:MAG: undecaprenyl/decaprenyl-phosphate alpha-N-acetylglucosaminyl 1-phosphate transferase [Bacilli bacterium]|nr:undecaprenyl/decaprenyl-phosphate alpha-N-acetylglucosaminyl 1-phosphate transferase [Bacilli bacterium]